MDVGGSKKSILILIIMHIKCRILKGHFRLASWIWFNQAMCWSELVVPVGCLSVVGISNFQW